MNNHEWIGGKMECVLRVFLRDENDEESESKIVRIFSFLLTIRSIRAPPTNTVFVFVYCYSLRLFRVPSRIYAHAPPGRPTVCVLTLRDLLVPQYLPPRPYHVHWVTPATLTRQCPVEISKYFKDNGTWYSAVNGLGRELSKSSMFKSTHNEKSELRKKRDKKECRKYFFS